MQNLAGIQNRSPNSNVKNIGIALRADLIYDFFNLRNYVNPILMFLCAILSLLEIGTPFTQQLILFLLALELIQYFLGWAVFSHLSKKL